MYKFTNTLRYFIKLSYNGESFHGWQTQENAVTVQETIENALQILLKQNKINIVGAGRTDAGVHAKEMIAHFDYDKILDSKKIIFKLNSFLNKNIYIINIKLVSQNLHARFDATLREYKYYLTQSKDVYNYHTKYYFPKKLDFDKIDKAINIIRKTKNFQSFCKTKTDVTNYECTIFEFSYEILGSDIIFTISANRFLRNMVRSIIGTILEIGISKISLDSLNEIILKSNRIYAGPSIPAHGLFLTKVEYPKNIL